ncbi:MAG: threonylcarbamoyl-AMP synthase [Candidatus Omnitrophica bacterium]|nr:threonylcarbamoyl-AMP synthase [Candidatus Omnitrophota bacterium]
MKQPDLSPTTRHIIIDPDNIDPDLIREAADVIRRGGLVAFPTETVYGLGANALDAKAVAKIFEAKKRPLDDPLIVHINDKASLDILVRDISPVETALAARFWPGALTLVLNKKDIIPDIVTTGLDSAAIRMPSGKIALALIKAAGVPIAAPSANLFGKTSPTTAAHVKEDLDGRIDLIIDGGSTDIGVESTVISVVDGEVRILRPGGVSVEEIREIVPRVKVYTEEEIIKCSPGKYKQHYAPRAAVVIVANDRAQTDKCLALAKEAAKRSKVGIMSKAEHAVFYKPFNTRVMGPGDDLAKCATGLFRVLREFDSDGTEIIFAEAVEERGLGLAIMNRLRKAAG